MSDFIQANKGALLLVGVFLFFLTVPFWITPFVTFVYTTDLFQPVLDSVTVYGTYQPIGKFSLEEILNFVASTPRRDQIVMVAISLLALLLMVRSQWLNNLSKKQRVWAIILIIIAGSIIRLGMAYEYYGNHDMWSWEQIADAGLEKGNFYATTYLANLAPPSYFAMMGLRMLDFALPSIPFHFLVKAFLTVVDLLGLGLLLLIAQLKNLSLPKTALLFYLNPVSFLLTGYHGQIENLAVLFLLLGIYLWLRPATVHAGLRKFAVWLTITFGFIIKHLVLPGLLVGMSLVSKKLLTRILLVGVSGALWLSLFIPYLPEGGENIRTYVFHDSDPGVYGITSIINWEPLVYVFLTFLVLYTLSLKDREPVQQFLLAFLFFFAFSTGMSVQYLVLPIAFAALRPSRGFLLYSTAVTLYLLGSYHNLRVPGFTVIPWLAVWLPALYWFFEEHRTVTQSV